MKLEVSNINIITSDIGDSHEDFWINIEIDISEIGNYGAETFTANIVSVERLIRITESGNILGRGIIICKEYDEIELNNIFENLIKKISASSWDEFIKEFEKYFEHI